jgi:hypothetical protein
MRFHGVAICTLTVFLAVTGGLKSQASENLSSNGSAKESVIPEQSVVNPTAAPKEIEAIASRQESPLEPSLSGHNTKAVAEAKLETVAEATPQVKVSERQALQADNSPTMLSTPKANPPALDQSSNKNSSLSSPLVGGTQESSVLSKAEALRPNEPITQSATTNGSSLTAQASSQADATCVAQAVSTPESSGSSATNQLAQGSTTLRRCPRPEPIAPVAVPKPVAEFESSPALSIYIPVGYGADRNTVFLSGSYQDTVRRDAGSVGAGGIGIGLGDARKSVGLELSYALETTDDSFGEGGFNAKLHRQLGQDLAGAIGWNGFLNIGRNDFEQSKYGVITKVFRTQESLNSPLSRVAVTVGVGDGQFRSNGAVAVGDNNVNVFGNVAIRVVRPVSFIAEWTGQDLALGLSIAPFRNFPFVITPAVRDVVGAGDRARFVLGAGTAIRF